MDKRKPTKNYKTFAEIANKNLETTKEVEQLDLIDISAKDGELSPISIMRKTRTVIMLVCRKKSMGETSGVQNHEVV